MFVKRTCAVPLLATSVLFFGAARFLPPVETGGESIAVLAGYTNRLIPLIAIVLAGALIMGVIVFANAREEAIALQLRMTGRSSWNAKYAHIIAACLLCVFVIAAVPLWSSEQGYFGQRVTMMADGLRPYKDFEYAYGYIVAYLPYALHLSGLGVRASLIVALGLFAVAGIVSFAIILERCVSHPGWRTFLFWLLVICETFVEPGPSLNYNFGRYAMPFAILSLLTEAITALSVAQTFAAFAGAVIFLDFVSPEIAFGFSGALLAWLVVVSRQVSAGKFAAGVVGALAAAIGTPIVLPDMFVTFVSYAQVQILMPVVPNFIMTLFVICFLGVGAINFAVTLSIWRGGQSRAAALQLSQPVAYALLSAGLLPAVVGRSWPTITIAYGFVPIVMSIGYLLQSGRKPMAWTVASVFAAFVVYSAQFGIRDDAPTAIHYLKTACARLHVPYCAEGQPSGARNERLLARATAAEFVRENYPNTYDPLAILGTPRPGVSAVGYYVGLTDITTQQGLDRKVAELGLAPHYILPASEYTKAVFGVRNPERSLSAFARASLYPLPLNAVAHPGRFKDAFIAMLYQNCHQIAAFEGFIVCRQT